MDIKSIKKEEIARFRAEVVNVIEGKSTHVNSIILHPGDIESLLDEIGEEEAFNTNGWDYDFWKTWRINTELYTLSGSGWYGGLSFYKDNG